MEVRNKLNIEKIDGKQIYFETNEVEKIVICNDDDDHDFIVLEVNGKKYTLHAKCVIKAVENATNF